MIDAMTDITLALGKAIKSEHAAMRFMADANRMGILLDRTGVVPAGANLFDSIFVFAEDLGVIIRRAMAKNLQDVVDKIPYISLEEIGKTLKTSTVNNEFNEIIKLFYTTIEYMDFIFNNTRTDVVCRLNPYRLVLTLQMKELIPYSKVKFDGLSSAYIPMDEAIKELTEAFK